MSFRLFVILRLIGGVTRRDGAGLDDELSPLLRVLVELLQTQLLVREDLHTAAGADRLEEAKGLGVGAVVADEPNEALHDGCGGAERYVLRNV